MDARLDELARSAPLAPETPMRRCPSAFYPALLLCLRPQQAISGEAHFPCRHSAKSWQLARKDRQPLRLRCLVLLQSQHQNPWRSQSRRQSRRQSLRRSRSQLQSQLQNSFQMLLKEMSL